MNSTPVLTDTARSVLKSSHGRWHAYTPHGFTHPTHMGRVAYNAQVPESGFYLLGHGYRAYSPTLYRFLSSDALSPFGKGGVNSYAYCAGDPVNKHDNSGAFWKRIKALFSRHSSGMDELTEIVIHSRASLSPLEQLACQAPHVAQNIAQHLDTRSVMALGATSRTMHSVAAEALKARPIERLAIKHPDVLGNITQILDSRSMVALNRTSKAVYHNTNRISDEAFLRQLPDERASAVLFAERAHYYEIPGVMPSSANNRGYPLRRVRKEFPYGQVRAAPNYNGPPDPSNMLGFGRFHYWVDVFR
ncbi:RHS repeat-associated core domain-containing protein [Pseudomonas massiliensis]|uniref:RHS repeat-associated core domain-containing protein n=1 Tax=Pseudomonas massiliensis TaxID=522492 RepID=UPI000B5871C0|nr:RHS repeat-associated core domain-containing protein [Pseudomonas massiliensis]